MTLPLVQTPDRLLNQVQQNVKSQLDPVVAAPIVGGILLRNISLASGANVVPHKLGRALQGWVPTRVRASATLYDTQDSNTTPASTLQLTASAAVVVDLWVF